MENKSNVRAVIHSQRHKIDDQSPLEAINTL